SPSSWVGDGIDHINIHYFGQTELGQMLDFSYKLTFYHDVFYNFNTISGFWAYIRSEERPDQLRDLVGRPLQELTRKVTNRKVKHLRAIIMDTAYQRIKGNTKLAQMFFENERPFDMYKVMDSGVPIRLAHHDWSVGGYTEIQRAMHSGSVPDFSFLCDGETSDIYESVRPDIEKFKAQIESRKNNIRKTSSSPYQSKGYEKKEYSKKYKPEDDVHTFDPKDRYMLLAPVVNERTENLILESGRNIIMINNTQVETGMVVANVTIPLLEISDDEKFYSMGLQTEGDVVRASPVLESTFTEGFGTNNVIKLNQFFIEDNEEKEISFTLLLKLINKSFEKKGDNQLVEVLEDGTQVIKRDVLLYKLIKQVET
ncbi:MAG TPA: hypothetical protein VN843_08780, partial [Anaerolineales bacterium]|nr:hypothetical protein [Anaerolineales bacterium]